MSKTRFDGYIHSIVGHQIMISPSGDGAEQFKCALDDFDSIMPTGSVKTNAQAQYVSAFTFHVKRDRIGVEHYRRWLGMEKIEKDRLGNIETALLEVIKWIEPKKTHEQTQYESIVDPDSLSPEQFAKHMWDKVGD